jgi:hypothetical protein
MLQSLFPVSQYSDGFAITASDTVDIKDDVANLRSVNQVFLHNVAAGATVRVLPAGAIAETAVTLTGSSGTANITVNGVNYLATYTSSLATSAANFVTTHATTLKGLGIIVENKPSSAVLIFRGANPATFAIANVSGNLAGTLATAGPITIYIAQGSIFPLPVKRVYATSPTPPAGLIGLFGGSK